jgi:hypothetical protein
MATVYTLKSFNETAVTNYEGTTTAIGKITVPAAGLVINDTFKGPRLPRFAVLVDAWLHTIDLDTHGTPLVTLTLRATDGSTPKNAFGSSTVGRAGGTARMDTAGVFAGYKIPNHNYYLELLVAAAPATTVVAGDLFMFCSYVMDIPDEL